MRHTYTFPKEAKYHAIEFINSVEAQTWQVRASGTVYDLDEEAKEQTFMDLVDASAAATHEIILDVDWETKGILISI